jgi:hypothetical protein
MDYRSTEAATTINCPGITAGLPCGDLHKALVAARRAAHRLGNVLSSPSLFLDLVEEADLPEDLRGQPLAEARENIQLAKNQLRELMQMIDLTKTV